MRYPDFESGGIAHGAEHVVGHGEEEEGEEACEGCGGAGAGGIVGCEYGGEGGEGSACVCVG